MEIIDWAVLITTLLIIVFYGSYRTRKNSNIKSFLKANNSTGWFTIGLSVMATQASAITFLSTPGQAYNDGMGFIQFYFGLPLAMIIICIFFVPLYHRLKVYTAYEFLEKPFSSDKILNYVNRALENLKLKSSNENLESKLFHSFDIIGKNNQIIKIKKLIEKLSSAESRVLITGDTGTGKELIARKIHKSSPRKNFPFIVLNSALLQPKKYEKELFGEEFRDGTIAYGALEKANKGTLLIDEVSEIPLETQASILRVLIDQKFRRINGNKDIYVNIRIVASTSKDLKKSVEENKFREDLYHRLNVVPIYVPTLQSRSDDIPLLIDYFKRKICEMNGIQEAKINTGNDMLYSYDWPGNIRELRNLVERISILSLNESEKSVDKYLNSILSQSPSTNNKIGIITQTKSFPLKEAREVFEKKYLENQLKQNQGNISKTADFIGMERSALHRKLKSLGIKGIN